MTANEILAKVKGLNLPADSYVVFGSAPMAVAGIREANDIDLVVSSEVLEKLKQAGWKRIKKDDDDQPLTHDVFEVHDSWGFDSSYRPTLQHLLVTATIVDGVAFASLEEVLKWKTVSARPKDLADIELIDKYLKN